MTSVRRTPFDPPSNFKHKKYIKIFVVSPQLTTTTTHDDYSIPMNGEKHIYVITKHAERQLKVKALQN